MNSDQAQSAVTLSAFVVAAIFAYRKLTETVTGSSSVPNTGHFVIGFGFTYIVLAILAQGAPALGGTMAVLVAVGDTLNNGQALVKDITGALNRTATAAGGKTVGSGVGAAPGATSNAGIQTIPVATHNPGVANL